MGTAPDADAIERRARTFRAHLDVVIQQVGHHVGLSDADMHALAGE